MFLKFFNLRLSDSLRLTRHFLTNDIWRIRAKDLSPRRSLLIQQLRVFLVALRRFAEDRCVLMASALTFYSLLSVVPVMAMIFGIAKGFGLEDLLQKFTLEKFNHYQQVGEQIITFSTSWLQNVKGGVIAGVGVIFLFWTVSKLLGNIEDSFNLIWGIPTRRGLIRRFADYTAIIIICPVLLITASSLTILVTSQLELLRNTISFFGILRTVVFILLHVTPFLVVWVVFTFLYAVIPNAKVHFGAALLGGIIAGTLYEMTQWVYLTFQIGVSYHNAVYGSFAALPLFLIWMQLSWLIVLFGAEIAFAHQNIETYEFEPDYLKVSHAFKRLLTLEISHLCIKRIEREEEPLSAEQISHDLDIPIRLVRQILFELVNTGLFFESKEQGEDKNNKYLPARNINDITLLRVINAMETHGINDLPVKATPTLRQLARHLDAMRSLIEQSPDNKRLKDI